MNDTGVVERLRPPAVAVRAWRRTPPLARAYLALGLATWALGVAPAIGQADLLTLPLILVAAPLAQAAFVALPAALLLRRADAPARAPLLFRGAVALALVTFLSPFVEDAPRLLGFVEPYLTGVGWLVAFAVAVASAVAIVAVAIGLLRLETQAASPVLQAFGAIAAFGAVVVPIAATLADAGQMDLGAIVPPGWAPWLFPIALVGPLLAPLAQGALLLVAVRALDDAARPLVARRLAAGAVALRVILPAAIVGLQVTGIAATAIGDVVTLLFSLAAGPWPTIALVVAFGLGLADPADPEPVRGRRAATPADLRARTRS